jgi:hypothetical protein
MRWTEHGAHMGKKRGSYRVLVGKLEGKRPLGMCRHRWEDNIKRSLQEVGREAWSGFIWFRIWRGDRLLLTYLRTYFFYLFNPSTWGHSPKDIEHVKNSCNIYKAKYIQCVKKKNNQNFT